MTTTTLNTALTLEALITKNNLAVGDEVLCVKTASSYYTLGDTYKISKIETDDCRCIDNTGDNFKPNSSCHFEITDLTTKQLKDYDFNDLSKLMRLIEAKAELEYSAGGTFKPAVNLLKATTFEGLTDLNGRMVIRLKPRKSAAQLKLEELETQQRDLADAIAEVRKTL